MSWQFILRLASMMCISCAGTKTEPFVETEAEGIYNTTAWTLNEFGCDAGGRSIFDNPGAPRFAYVRNENRDGDDVPENVRTRSVSVNQCLSVEDCTTHATSSMINFGSKWFLFDGNDTSGYVNDFITGFDPGPLCSSCDCGLQRTILTLTISESSIAVEERRLQQLDVPSVDGNCPARLDADVLERVRSQPCARSERLTATFHSNW